MEETPQSIETSIFYAYQDQQEAAEQAGIETQISNDKEQDSEALMPPGVVSSASASASASASKVVAMSNMKKSLLVFGFISGFAALYAGLAVTLTIDSKNASDATNGDTGNTGNTGTGFNGPSAITIQTSRLHYFNASSLGGYEECSELQLDLKEAIEIIGNISVSSMADYFFSSNYYSPGFVCRGGGDQCFTSILSSPSREVFKEADSETVAEAPDTNADAPSAPSTSDTDTDNSRENSFGTNNQVQGVDEADLVKSDGTHVFVAYADKVKVWNANDGTMLSTTIIPTLDDQGIDLCKEADTNAGGNIDTVYTKNVDVDAGMDCYHYHMPYYMFGRYQFSAPDPIKVSSLLLHTESQRLVVIASTEYTRKHSTSLLKNEKQTRVFIYDISPQAILDASAGNNANDKDTGTDTDNTPLALLARYDVDGRYQTARSIEEYAHIVTSSSLDFDSIFFEMLHPSLPDFADMNETEYRNAAYDFMTGTGTGVDEGEGDNALQGLVQSLAGNLTKELISVFTSSDSDSGASTESSDCSKISKVALMLKAAEDTDQDSNITTTRSILPSFTANTVLKTLTLVHSFDISQAYTNADTSTSTVSAAISTNSSGVFFPTQSYTSNVYASASKLVVAGEAYVEGLDGNWDEHTILLVFNLFQGTSTPESIGDVNGSLLNQFSMDHYTDPNTDEEYLRVATTSWARWGLLDGGNWGQVQVSESQVTVLQMNGSGSGSGSSVNEGAGPDAASLQVVGSVTGIGLDERIYAVRFYGLRAYLVTFKQIDPFYILDMADPTNPFVAGELKIPGYSVSIMSLLYCVCAL